jgi:stearoyl-CoA 9-desaturase NADPH oxidoreductase
VDNRGGVVDAACSGWRPSGCRMGICHSCVASLRSGRVRDLRTGDEHGEEGELVQTCVSAAVGPVDIDV